MYYALWDKQCDRMMCTGRNCTTKDDVKEELWSYMEQDREEIFLTDNVNDVTLDLLLEVGEFDLMESEAPYDEDD